MGTLDNHQSNDYVKLLLIGDAKSGKTGSLVSLVKAGYHLRILDLDNLLDTLKQYVMKECPDKAGNVEYRTIRDKRKAAAGGAVISGTPKAFIDCVKMLDRWKYTDGDGKEIDLGSPGDWDKDTILVIDSLSRLCDAAYDWQDFLTPVGKNSGEKDGRAVYGNAQDAVENLLSMLTGPLMEANIIVIAHGSYYDLPDGTKIFPQGVGQKLSPKIPQYFPNVIRYKNMAGKRTIQLKSDAMIDLANAAPFAMPDTFDIGDGLAKFFAVLRNPPKQETAPTKPKSVTLQRV